jgi:flagellar FliJ protein
VRRFRFELEKLLELRSYAEREAELALARAMGELSSIESKIQALAVERTEVASQRFARGRGVAEIRHAEAYILRLDQTKEKLLEAAAAAALGVEKEREKFIEASRERKIIDKLKEKRAAEHRKAALDEEMKVVDDISSGSAARKALNAPD